jgi:hypothetical protein
MTMTMKGSRLLGVRAGLAAASSCFLLMGCSSAAPPGPSSFDASARVSLRTDVLPVFSANCAALPTCHGSPTGIEVFLAGGAANASAIRKGIVGVDSVELPTMPFVTAGDPTRSYLMLKLDGTQGAYDAQCAGATCGAQMPYGAPSPLDATTRDAIRAWITQGALDN